MVNKTRPSSRRFFLAQAGGAAALDATGLLGQQAVAGGHLPMLDPADPQARALAYVHESATEGQKCNNSQLYKGGDKAWGKCPIFTGKEVNGQGWCKSWVKKTIWRRTARC